MLFILFLDNQSTVSPGIKTGSIGSLNISPSSLKQQTISRPSAPPPPPPPPTPQFASGQYIPLHVVKGGSSQKPPPPPPLFPGQRQFFRYAPPPPPPFGPPRGHNGPRPHHGRPAPGIFTPTQQSPPGGFNSVPPTPPPPPPPPSRYRYVQPNPNLTFANPNWRCT